MQKKQKPFTGNTFWMLNPLFHHSIHLRLWNSLIIHEQKKSWAWRSLYIGKNVHKFCRVSLASPCLAEKKYERTLLAGYAPTWLDLNYLILNFKHWNRYGRHKLASHLELYSSLLPCLYHWFLNVDGVIRHDTHCIIIGPLKSGHS